MKILAPNKIQEVDAYTIKNEPILDINLMERAAQSCTSKIIAKIKLSQNIYIFCGSGNNGGDGLAIARKLAEQDFKVQVFLISEKLSKSAEINLTRLRKHNLVTISLLAEEKDLPSLKKGNVIIDAIFGSGLSRPASGFVGKVIETINKSKNFVISIDIPSGFFAEDNSSLTFNENLGYYSEAVKANWTLTLELPFLSFMFPDSEQNVGDWEIVPIGLHHEFLRKIECDNHYIDAKRIRKGIKKRKKFSHKGTYGHALLIAGTFGRMGAAILASKACMRAGVGLLTTHIPRYGYEIMQTTIPEAMLNIDRSDILISEVPDVIWSTNQKGETIYISPNVEKIYGYSPKEIYKAKGKLFLDRIHPDDVKNVEKLYSLLFTEGKTFDVEYRIKRKDGKWIWLYDRATFIFEENGGDYATGIFSDITDKKLIEEKLKKNEENERIFNENLTLLHKTLNLACFH